VVIAAVDERDAERRARQAFGGFQPAEAAAQNDDVRFCIVQWFSDPR